MRHVLITGGAGFIGTNLAHRYLSEGHRVMLFDNLSRPGVRANAAWLRDVHGTGMQLVVADVADRALLARAVASARIVFHFAAQVAVTSSLAAPGADFEVNARGTLNLLECVRAAHHRPPVVFTSTNKVYGDCAGLELEALGDRYAPRDPRVRAHGIDESRPLDFHSPYGCSKGAADQYVLDYARSYGLRSVVFRMSCIYGEHQFGTEDQGWVAHFARRVLASRPITIYGDGRQVRDLLFADDLVEAFLAVDREADRLAGTVFNIGGGPENATSVLEVAELLARRHDVDLALQSGPWRTGDQRYYVSDTRRFRAATGWAPRIGVEEGIARLYAWLRQEAACPPATPRGGRVRRHAVEERL